jgi:HEAT repeat protein
MLFTKEKNLYYLEGVGPFKVRDNNLNDKSSIEKLDIIERIEESEYEDDVSLEILTKLSKDQDSEVRSRTAETLVLFDSTESEDILIELLNDEDELVRTNASDSLSISTSVKVISLLKGRILKDESSLVRRYAILSIGDIVNRIGYDKYEIIDFLTNQLEKEEIIGVKLCYYTVLYTLGEEKYLDLLLELINEVDYQDRCGIVSLLSDIISEKNVELIKTTLNNRLQVEDTIAVRSDIEKLLKEL